MSGLASELLHLAKQAAAAGADVLARRSVESLGAQTKSSDSDWVTVFDLAAERAVRDVISRSRPHDVITGEELGTSIPDRASGAGRVRWSIDPLDGTTNFIRNIVYYCTSVAAMDADGQWLAGVVHAPALDRVYWAAKGQGAWVRDHGRVTRLDGPDVGRKGALFGTGFSYDPVARTQQVRELGGLMEGFGDVRRIGSAALDLCMVADGTLDGYAERGLNEHDWAAGALIAEEAGATVLRPNLTSALAGGPGEGERFAAVTIAGAPGLVPRATKVAAASTGGAE
ncbi:inositol monophosphatase family protein [Arthrobacter sp. TMN-50]